MVVCPLPTYASDTIHQMPTELANNTATPVIRIASIFSRLFLRDRCRAVTVPSLVTAEDEPGGSPLVRLPPGPQHLLARVHAAKSLLADEHRFNVKRFFDSPVADKGRVLISDDALGGPVLLGVNGSASFEGIRNRAGQRNDTIARDKCRSAMNGRRSH